jgi:hypothetical protein
MSLNARWYVAFLQNAVSASVGPAVHRKASGSGDLTPTETAACDIRDIPPSECVACGVGGENPALCDACDGEVR